MCLDHGDTVSSDERAPELEAISERPTNGIEPQRDVIYIVALHKQKRNHHETRETSVGFVGSKCISNTIQFLEFIEPYSN